jgi:GH24 family phage-related lysozyme (muramidase)
MNTLKEKTGNKKSYRPHASRYTAGIGSTWEKKKKKKEKRKNRKRQKDIG